LNNYAAQSGTVTVTVSASPIDAVNDSAGPVNGLTGATNVLNVFGNDTLNGVAVNPADVTLTRQAGGDPELVLNPDGSVDVPLGTSAGSYSFDYQICENLNPTNCDIATVTVTVVTIDAVNDSGATVNGAVGGTSIADILVNDSLNGVAATVANVTITAVGVWPAGVTLDTGTGAVMVAAGTAAGTYTPQYQICSQANPSFCDTATVTVPVVVIEAVNDTGATIDGAVGGTSISNVLVNDTLNGASATTSNVTITAVGVWPAGVALDTGTGEVTVAAGTAAGTYTPQYQICSQTDPSVCDTATVTVPVVVIDAVNDSGMAINGSVGGTSIADVLVNDTLNGAAATTGNVTITAVGIWPSGVTLNTSTGAVTVASGTAAGTYTPQYQICSQANPSVCDTATVTVPVSAAPIDAVDDSAGPVNGLTGATNVLNVFGNDTLNGVAVNPADVTLTRQAGGDPELVLNPDGSVDVPLGTSAGSYSFDYQICENLNPTNCDIATVTVTVVVIDAVNDSGSAVNGAAGGTSLANVLVNDTLNGNPATLATVDMTFVSSTHAGVTLDLADGSVDVAAGTPAGNYTLTYQICDRANPAICDTATVAVPVAANNPPTATDNEAAVDTTTPAHTANMVTDDEGNGVDSDPDGDSLTVTQVDGETNPAIVLVGTYGTLDWATDGSYTYTIDTSDTDFLLLAGGATGTETFLYTISDGYGGTATADIIITVTGADDVPVANDDSFTIVEDTTLNGDLRPDHGSGADAPSGDGGNVWSEVTGAGPSHGTVTVNPNGTFTYNPDANYNGPDSFTYQICDVDNDCDQAVVNLTVTSVDDPSIGIAKRVANVTRSGSGSFDVTMEFHVQNYGDVTLNNVQVTDDLSVTFPAPSTFTVQSVTISNQTNAVLTANPGYNGSTDTALLTPLGNSLAINGSGTITVLVHVLPSISGPFYNSAVTTGEPPSGTLVTDDSADGTDPDNTNNCPSCINGDGDPTNNTKLTEVNFDPNIFDPPFGFKELDASGLPVLRWTLIWINDNNFPSVAAVSDPIPARTTYEATGASSGYAVPGGAPSGSTNVGVSCTTDSAAEPAPGDAESSTSLCYYEGPTGTYPRGRIVWEGALGPDLGATNQANANDEVYISFTVRVGTGVTTVQNVATIDADLNNDGDRTDSGEQVVATAQAAWQEPITPVDGREGKKLPATGFAPNKVTTLPDQKPEQAYLNLGDLWLEIPSLGIKTSIVGVPKVDGVWNVDWLWEQTGWLQGTAFPTWKGNSLLTAHVYLPDGKPGPFLDLGKLRYGDQVIVHAFGQRHVFEIRANNIILPIDMSPFKHEEKAWLTLLTCKGYEESSDTYKYRVAVRAVLVKIEPE
jgi:LPXTG-site transpeptidase (sortase) family protein